MRTIFSAVVACSALGCGIDLTVTGPDGGYVLLIDGLAADGGNIASGTGGSATTGGSGIGTPTVGTSSGAGAGTSAGATSSGGPTSGSTSGCGCTGSAPQWPQVPSGGGAVIAAPALVLITFDGDAHRSDLEGDVAWLANGGYLAQVAAQYGVGNGSVRALVHLNTTAPGPATVQSFLQARLDDGSLPPVDATTVYLLTLPASAPTTPAFCAAALGYHSAFYATGGALAVFAVVPDCANDARQSEVTLSHELVEAATDPAGNGYRISDPSNPWTYLGGEVGDLCESYGTTVADPSGQYAAQTIWSNAAAAAGQVPCVPWPSALPYRTLVSSEGAAVPAAAGSTVTVALSGYASLATGTWSVAVADVPLGDFTLAAALSSPIIGNSTEIQVTLTVPPGASAGQHGAVWLFCQDSATGENLGSTVVAVAVQ